MSDFVLDASLALQWFLEDEADRKYSLRVLASLAQHRAVVPSLWFYEIGNGLVMALRRKRISVQQLEGFLVRLRELPIGVAQHSSSELLELPRLAQTHGLTNYDSAYLALAIKFNLPLATTDRHLQQVAAAAHVNLLAV